MDLLTPRAGGGAVLVGLVVGLVVGAAAARHRAAPPLLPTLGASPGPVVVAVLQPGDCDGRLEALAPVVRAADRAGARVVVRVPGGTTAAQVVASRLRDLGWQLPVSRASPAAVRALRHLGHVGTPLLAIADARGRLVFAAPLPETPDALVRWHAVLPLLLPS
ncbi:MAG: hypothetical protein ACK6CY_16730 [Gemmatimonadota bacterium]